MVLYDVILKYSSYMRKCLNIYLQDKNDLQSQK